MFFRKILLALLVVSGLSLITASKTQASLLTIDKNGEIVVNVLAEVDDITLQVPDRELVAIKEVATGAVNGEARVTLTKIGDEMRLNVLGSDQEKSLDVSDYQDSVVEIEERPEVEKIAISVLGDKFLINQRGVSARTNYEIDIDPRSAGLTLKTPSGLRFLSILPREAVDTALRSKLINRFTEYNTLTIEETEAELAYKVDGERVFDLFNLLEYSLPVTARISATTGEIMSIDNPKWLKFVAFLFV
jgi:hypothetical protein